MRSWNGGRVVAVAVAVLALVYVVALAAVFVVAAVVAVAINCCCSFFNPDFAICNKSCACFLYYVHPYTPDGFFPPGPLYIFPAAPDMNDAIKTC